MKKSKNNRFHTTPIRNAREMQLEDIITWKNSYTQKKTTRETGETEVTMKAEASEHSGLWARGQKYSQKLEKQVNRAQPGLLDSWDSSLQIHAVLTYQLGGNLSRGEQRAPCTQPSQTLPPFRCSLFCRNVPKGIPGNISSTGTDFVSRKLQDFSNQTNILCQSLRNSVCFSTGSIR